MTENISKSIEIYKEQLEEGYIQLAYKTLMDYMGELKSRFPKEYSTGNISFGNLDYTYFSFFNEDLRNNKLRFGIVLNHSKMQFELWLMGRNAEVQDEYWDMFKESKWNIGVETRPRYSVLEVCLEDRIDFENKERMTLNIFDKASLFAREIEDYIIEKKSI